MSNAAKIGFVVQPGWQNQHFGVRNYFNTLASILSETSRVDFLVYRETEAGIFMWYIEDTVYPPLVENKLHGIDFSAEKSANFISHRDFESFQNKYHNAEMGYEAYYQCIGVDLAVEHYDIVVLTNPWLINFNKRLDAKKVVGIVYDLIANQFSLTKMTLDYNWAYLHNNGNRYYLENCDEIYAISEAVASEFNEYYKTDRCKFFPAFPPYQFKEAEYNSEGKETAMLLAAPFDPRKGINDMPELINCAYKDIDILYIYGMPRCPVEMFDQFFKKLLVRRIVYYPWLSYEKLIQLYKKCKVLLFPSIEEGLGLPIIEAQICGCRVVTSDKAPMNTLTLEGSYLIKQNNYEEVIVGILKDTEYDYKMLSRKSKRRFSYENVKAVFEEIAT